MLMLQSLASRKPQAVLMKYIIQLTSKIKMVNKSFFGSNLKRLKVEIFSDNLKKIRSSLIMMFGLKLTKKK